MGERFGLQRPKVEVYNGLPHYGPCSMKVALQTSADLTECVSVSLLDLIIERKFFGF